MKINKNAGGVIISGVAERDKGITIFDYYIGIDPDIDESGYAQYHKPKKNLELVTNYSFFDLLRRLQYIKTTARPKQETLFYFVVHIEGGWLVSKSNFHTSEKKGFHTIKESRVAQRIAQSVGRNHEVGRLIVQMCIDLDISFVVREPITPIFQNEAFFKQATKYSEKTNHDGRSAANYVFSY